MIDEMNLTNNELVIVMKVLNHLLWMDEHLLETSPHLNYAPFKFHNRMLWAMARDSLKLPYLDKIELLERMKKNE